MIQSLHDAFRRMCDPEYAKAYEEKPFDYEAEVARIMRDGEQWEKDLLAELERTIFSGGYIWPEDRCLDTQEEGGFPVVRVSPGGF